jgi:hypothetical protein
VSTGSGSVAVAREHASRSDYARGRELSEIEEALRELEQRGLAEERGLSLLTDFGERAFAP